MKAVGDLRGEPLVASLLSYICSLFFSLMENHWKLNDSAWLNLIGLLFYLVYLGLFLKYAQHPDRQAMIVKWVPASTAYVLLIVAAGKLAKSTLAVKWMYMLAGLASACTPLGLALFVLEKNVENLPDWLSSTVGLLHYSVWVSRAFIPERDYFDMVQNASGMVCSINLLLLLFTRRNQALPVAGPGVDVYAPLLVNQHVVIQVAQDDANNEGQVGANDEGQVGANDEAQDDANNEGQVDANNEAQDDANNEAQVDANDEAQDDAINHVKAEANQQLGANIGADANPQLGANNGVNQAIINHVGDANPQLGANLQPEPIHPQLLEPRRAASAPATPEKAVALMRSSSV